MNMIGAPKHVKKAIDAGVDIICAQGGEGGGHTGEVATSVRYILQRNLAHGRKQHQGHGRGQEVPRRRGEGEGPDGRKIS